MNSSISIKRWSVWRLLALFAVTAALITGCGPDTTSSTGVGTGGTGVLTAVTVPGVKSVYLTRVDTSTASPAGILSNKTALSPSAIQTLGYINSTGKNVPVVFQTSTGKHVVLNITSLKAIRDSFITIAFNSVTESQETSVNNSGQSITYTATSYQLGQALVDMNSGKVYNLQGYDIQNVLVDNSFIYITKNDKKDLFKIAFNDLSHAIPLNNGAYTPAGTIRYLLNKWIVGDDHLFDKNAVAIPKPVTATQLTTSQGTINIDPRFNEPPYIVDNAGNLWGYRGNTNGSTAKFQVSLDDDGNTVVSNYQEVTFNLPAASGNGGNPGSLMFVINGSGSNADVLWVGGGTYLFVKRNADSGIRFEAGIADFGSNFPGWFGNCASYYNGSVYWISSGKIYSMNLSQNLLTVVYQSPSLVDPVILSDRLNNWNYDYITLTLTNGTLVFYQYTTATNVGTYALTIGNATPALLSESQASIDQIVELNF